MKQRLIYYGKLLLVTGALAVLCCLFLLGCGHHHQRNRSAQSNLNQSIKVDEFIGSIGIIWPKEWSDGNKADARRGIIAHLIAWELEFGKPPNPAVLIVLLDDLTAGGIDVEDRDIILIAPGNCFEFPALFNLLTHREIGDSQEVGISWLRWNSIGDQIAADIRELCLIIEPPTDPEPAPTPAPGPGPEDTDADPDGDDSDEGIGEDERRCKRDYRKWLKQSRPQFYKWCKNRYSKWWHRHWWKHWRPDKQQHAEFYALLKSCKD